MTKFRRLLLGIITFIGGLYFCLEFFLPTTIAGYKFGAYHEEILTAVQVVGVMSIGLGILNIFRVYGRTVIRQQKGWFYSLILVASFSVALAVELASLIQSERQQLRLQQLEACATFATQELTMAQVEALKRSLADFSQWLAFREDAQALQTRLLAIQTTLVYPMTEASASELKQLHAEFRKYVAQTNNRGPLKSVSRFLYGAFFVPLGSAMFSLLAFYIATAAYRSFRVRSLEASIMMVAALLVILGQIPHGPLYISERLPGIRLWLLENISTPAFRAIFFGTSIASLAMAVRMWLSLERGPLDEEDR